MKVRKDKYYIMSPRLSQSTALSKLLRENGIKCVAVSDDINDRSLLSAYDDIIDEKEIYNLIAGREEVDDIIPTGAISTRKILSRVNVRLGKIVATKENLQVFDKKRFLEKAEKGGVSIPKTWACLDDIASSEYPIFYKQGEEKGGGVRGVAYKKEDIPMNDNLIYQKYIDSPGTYGVGFLADKGEMITFLAHYERESWPKNGGSAVIIEKCNDKRLYEKTKKLIEIFNFSGWGLAEWKYDFQIDDYVLMEINSKFWASCEFSLRNQNEFLKNMFDIIRLNENIERMCFLNLALERGYWFILNNKKYILNSKIVFRAIGTKEKFVPFVPPFFRPWVRKIWRLLMC